MRDRRPLRPGADPARPRRADPEDLRMVRGILVCLLADAYPNFMAEALLTREVPPVVVSQLGVDVAAQYAYLAEKSYIEAKTDRLGDREIRSWRLTATGLDVATGVTTDPGVDVDSHPRDAA